MAQNTIAELNPTCIAGADRQIRGLGKVFAVVATWYQRHKTRKTLRGMSDYLLRDVGLTRLEADAESIKPFWTE